ncbi:hypothetical protein OG562_23165 [Streptomyces sp. NBC_01275]|uniref:hypothetical protein n=1 Tax=Streptomyces sp. NBC_01275 TaxID=2903807 RepID=UPI00225B1886|nr:hypothetical protein [Streptomyces sp. NBC_01275]MCX4763814.1 hypothetical protein [Streptomyces sp. NBC_01275]
MKRKNAVRGNTHGSLVLDVRDREWSARMTYILDQAGPALLLSLPRGLFLAHDQEMSQAGAGTGPQLEDDVEYLSAVWGFTRLDGDQTTEIADTPLIGVRPAEEGLAVDLAGYPWLFVDGLPTVPEEWTRPAAGSEAESSCLLGICFGVDLRAPDADMLFLSELGSGNAALGQVNVVKRM